MLDWKKRAEAKGNEFPNGLKDVQQDPDCNAEWQNLTKQEKGFFGAKAKNDKIASQISSKDKKTSFGESIRMLEQKEEEARRFIENMHENIKVIIDSSLNLKILPQVKFCFVHVNWFFRKLNSVNNTLEYFPAEYAFGIFSFENGIEEIHHAIVSAPIPLGYRREALETSANDHKIPVEYQGGEKDFVVIYEKLINFLESRQLAGRYTYLYTTKEFTKPVQSFIAQLCDVTKQDKEQFKIYEMEALFTHLANELYKKRSDRDMHHISIYSEKIFKEFTYIFEKGYECEFHKYVDGGHEYCCKSVLYQWAWTLCEEFCDPLDIEMQPRIHLPDKFNKPDLDNSDPNKHNLCHLMSSLQVGGRDGGQSEAIGILSMTGVSEQHRLKVSSRTYEDEMRRRNESKPVQVIDCGKESASDEPVNQNVNKNATSIEEGTRYVPKYLNEKPLRPPNLDPRFYVTATDDFLPIDDENFPPIGGRGVSIKSRKSEVRKAPLGRGKGHA